MLSTSYAAAFHKPVQLNIGQYFDGEHGQNRDVWNTASDLGLKDFMYVLMMAVNEEHGPDDSNLRHHQKKYTLTKYYTTDP